jgi:hypothetical protein
MSPQGTPMKVLIENLDSHLTQTRDMPVACISTCPRHWCGSCQHVRCIPVWLWGASVASGTRDEGVVCLSLAHAVMQGCIDTCVSMSMLVLVCAAFFPRHVPSVAPTHTEARTRMCYEVAAFDTCCHT